MKIKQVIGVSLAVLLFIGIYTNSVEAEEEIIHEIEFSVDDISFGTQNDYDSVTLPDCIFTIEPGKPRLPLKVLHFAIDRDKDISQIEIIADTTEEVQGQYNIYPAQEPTRMDQEPEFTPPDSAVYNSYQGYPIKRVELKAEGSLAGTKVIAVHVYPLEYIPAEKKLILHTTMTLRIIQESKSILSPQSVQPVRTAKANDTVKSMLRKVVSNPEYIEEQFKGSLELQTLGMETLDSGDSTIDYLIITSEELKNSGVYQPLIDSKVARGLSVEVESTENIEASYSGRDSAEKIRNCIKDKWANNGLVWVLLGGDTNIVPLRMARVGGDDVPCDMYYSDLDGDWDANGNDYFGEVDDNVDMYPDVFVGRAPVESEEEAQVFVGKVLTYEANVPYYANKALLYGINYKNDIGGRINDFIDEEYMPPEFDPITKYYEREIHNCREPMLEAINQGHHIINHIDHAYIDELATGDYSILIDDIDSLTNILAPAILCSAGCWPAAIDEDCIAEHWINNPNGGGVAFVGNSRFGSWTYSVVYLNPEFFKSLFTESFTHIGQTLADSKMTFVGLAQSDEDARYYLLELNLLGDPEMNIWADTSLLPNISSPSMNAFIRGTVDIEGSVVCDSMNFAGYELYYALKDDFEDTTLITFSATPVEDGLLGTWDTTLCPDGEYFLALKVIDINSREFISHVSVTIDNYNQTPEFVNLTNKGAVIDRVMEFRVEALNTDDPETPWGQLTYSAYNLPSGAVFNPETQIFSWIPTESDKGIYEVEFNVSDSEYTTARSITVITVVIEEIPICTDSADQEFPYIYKEKILWQDMRNGNWDIYMYDLTTGEETPICTDPNAQELPVMYGDKIIWIDNRNSGTHPKFTDTGDWDIYIYDLTTGEETPLFTGPYYEGTPAIYKDKIVWEDKRDGGDNDIYMYDLTTGEETPICTNPYHSKFSPDIYEDKVVWTDTRDNLYSDIYMYNLSTNEEVQITKNDLRNEWLPVIYGNIIVFTGLGYTRIYMYDLETGKETDICSDYLGKYSTSIDKDKIIFTKNALIGGDDIFMYDISNNMEVCLTDGLSDHNKPVIHEDKIVWYDNRNLYYDDIYMAIIIYPPQIISIEPVEVSIGETLTITGENFGYDKRDSRVEFENGTVCSIESWSNTEITCTVPEDAETGLLKVITKGGESDGIVVTVVGSPSCWNCPTQCHGDTNCDGVVNTSDWPVFRDAFGTDYWNDWNDGAGPYNPCADFNRDGYVDTVDWPAFRDNFGKQVSADCGLGSVWPPEQEQSHPSCWDCTTQCHGDANCDGIVNTSDWLAFRDAFLKNYWSHWNDGAGPYNPCGDFNRDGYIDTADWPAFRDNFFKQVPSDCDIGGVWPPEE